MNELEFKNKIKELIENNSTINKNDLGTVLTLLSYDETIESYLKKLIKEEKKLKEKIEVSEITDKTVIASAIKTNIKKIEKEKRFLAPFIKLSVEEKSIIKQLAESLAINGHKYTEISM